MIRTPSIKLREVPRALFAHVPPEPRTLDPAVLSRLTWPMQRDYHDERIATFHAQAEAYGRQAEAWLWIAYFFAAVLCACVVALIVTAVVS